MEKWKYKINAVLEVMWMITLPLVIANGLFYLLGSFIAWDFDPFHWWAFTTTVGRVLFNEVVPEAAGYVNEVLNKKSLNATSLRFLYLKIKYLTSPVKLHLSTKCSFNCPISTKS